MKLQVHIPIKYKFLAVLLVIMLSSLSVFFYFAQKTFSEDKKLFVLDLNLTLLKAATSEVQLELKGRLEELSVLIPRIYKSDADAALLDPFSGLSTRMADDVIAVTIYRKHNNSLEVLKQYRNLSLLQKKTLEETFFSEINRNHPLNPAEIGLTESMDLLNRSIRLVTASGNQAIPILTVVLNGNFVNDTSREVIVVVDFLQEFLRKKLQQSEIAELFLISKKGRLLTHSSMAPTLDYAGMLFPHPIVQRLATKQFPRESLELDVAGEPYLCNLSETGFDGIYAVSQIRKSEAFEQLHQLLRQSVLLALLILSVAVIFSILFASKLTQNIEKLKEAAEFIGKGNLKLKIDIQSNDEIQNVAKSFQWMADRLKQLIAETAQKARMEDELETARLVQSTILSAPKIESEVAEIVSYYNPATECGGDFWDAHIHKNILTIFIGDATGHGAPAAIVTAVAKSCFTTLNAVYAEADPLKPDQLLSTLNRIVHSSCKGQLLMTMCVVQVNLDTGDLTICNAGHESPICLRSNTTTASSDITDKKKATEVFFARGERLGFTPTAEYEPVHNKLQAGDTILLYTDGISEARDMHQKEWGERSLKKAFALGGSRPLSKMKTEIVEAFDTHTRGTQQEDDVTFVLLAWKPKSKSGKGTQGPPALSKPGESTPHEVVKSMRIASAAIVNEDPVLEESWIEEPVVSEIKEEETVVDISPAEKKTPGNGSQAA